MKFRIDSCMMQCCHSHNNVTIGQSSVFTAHICYCCKPFSFQDISLDKRMQEYKNDHRSRMINISVPHFPLLELQPDMLTEVFFGFLYARQENVWTVHGTGSQLFHLCPSKFSILRSTLYSILYIKRSIGNIA